MRERSEETANAVVVTQGNVTVQHASFGVWNASILIDPFTKAELERRVEAEKSGGMTLEREGVGLSIHRDGTADLMFYLPITLEGQKILEIGLMVDDHDLSDAVSQGDPSAPLIEVRRDRVVQLVRKMAEGQEIRFRVYTGSDRQPYVIRVPLIDFDSTSGDWMLGVVDDLHTEDRV